MVQIPLLFVLLSYSLIITESTATIESFSTPQGEPSFESLQRELNSLALDGKEIRDQIEKLEKVESDSGENFDSNQIFGFIQQNRLFQWALRNYVCYGVKSTETIVDFGSTGNSTVTSETFIRQIRSFGCRWAMGGGDEGEKEQSNGQLKQLLSSIKESGFLSELKNSYSDEGEPNEKTVELAQKGWIEWFQEKPHQMLAGIYRHIRNYAFPAFKTEKYSVRELVGQLQEMLSEIEAFEQKNTSRQSSVNMPSLLSTIRELQSGSQNQTFRQKRDQEAEAINPQSSTQNQCRKWRIRSIKMLLYSMALFTTVLTLPDGADARKSGGGKSKSRSRNHYYWYSCFCGRWTKTDSIISGALGGFILLICICLCLIMGPKGCLDAYARAK